MDIALPIADAVAAKLTAASTDEVFLVSDEEEADAYPAFTAESSLFIDVELKVAGLRVQVNAFELSADAEARDTDGVDVRVQVIVTKRLDKATRDADARSLIRFVQLLFAYLRSDAGNIADDESEIEEVDVTDSTFKPLYSTAKLRNGEFWSTQYHTYRVGRDRNGAFATEGG